jgi:PIN domain nuclease of toxin-antitoxin system
LDTHAAIWVSEDEQLSEAAVEAIDRAADEGTPVFVSPITAWEVGLLVARGRLALPISPRAWFERLLEARYVGLAEMPASILIDSSFLPSAQFRDPADRILVATAREFGFALVTRDRALLSYADAGNLKAIAC